MTEPRRQGRFEARSEVRRLLELIGTYAIAVAQPVLSIFATSPETFVHLGAGRWLIIVYTLIVLFGPPLLLWGVELLLGLISASWKRWFHVGLISFGVGLFAFQLLEDSLGVPDPAALLIAGAAVAGASFGYVRLAAVRAWLAYLAPASVLFGAVFLVASPVADLVFPNPAAAADVQPSGPATPVVLIVFDEFPTLTLLDGDGEIDSALYPNFTALANDATWYRNATTVHTLTTHAVPAILTGQIPPTGARTPNDTGYPESIYTLLGNSYATNTTQEFPLCPAALCPAEDSDGAVSALGNLLRRSADIFSEHLTTDSIDGDVEASLAEGRAEASVTQQVSRFEEFTDRIGPGRTLSVAHKLLPHHYWRLNPSGTLSDSRYEEDYPIQTGGWPNAEAVEVGRQHHLLQTMYVDSMIGDVIDRLKELDAYDDALIIVTADHGISFEFHEPRRLSTAASIPEVAWVPLVVKLPGQTEGALSDENVMTIDIVPTIAEVVGVEIPWRVDGISLVNETRDESAKQFLPYVDNPEDYYPFGETLDGESVLGALLSRAKSRFVDTADPRMRPFARGPHGGLVGRPLADFVIDAPATSSGRFENGTDIPQTVDGDELEAVPVWKAGSFADDLGDDPQLAYVVDERIVATSGTYEPDHGRRRFETLLPEAVIDDGPLTIYLIEDTVNRPTLRQIRFEA